MEAGAAAPPPDRPEAPAPPPFSEQDVAEREPPSPAALEEQARAVPAASRTGEGELPSATLMAGITALRGPLPPPEVLAQYEVALPGAAERIFKMMERQEEHRQALERAESEADRALKREESEADRSLDGEELRLTHRREMSGIVAGAAVVFGVLATAVILAFLGATTPAAWLGGSSLAALAGVFIYGVRQGDTRGEEDAQSEDND